MLVRMAYRAQNLRRNSQRNCIICNSIYNKAKEVNEILKDKCEEHNSQLIQHHNINPFCNTNAKGLHLNNYGDKR